MSVHDALAPLDRLAVPDLREQIADRGASGALPTLERRPRRRPRRILVSAAALLLVGLIGFVAGRMLDRDGPRPDPADRSWAVTGTVDAGVDVNGRRAMVAAEGRWLWIGAQGGDVVVVLDAREGRPIRAASVRVGPVAAIDAAGDHATVLTSVGDVERVSTSGDARRLASLGALTPGGTASVVEAGGRVWVSGVDGVDVVVLDPASGNVMERLDLPGAVSSLVAARDVVWALDDAGSVATPVSVPSARVGDPISTGAVRAAVASGRSLWTLDPVTASLGVVERGGERRAIASVPSTADGLAAGGDLVWVHERGVVQGYDASGRIRESVAMRVVARSSGMSEPDLGSVAASGERVWAVDWLSGTVYLIRPERR